MFCLNGKGAYVSCEVFPTFDVSEGDWEIGLVDLVTYNTIPNIEQNVNDKFYYGSDGVVTIPTGSYEITDIEKVISDNLPKNVEFSLKPNNNTLRTELLCSEPVDFSKADCVGPLLGFDSKLLDAKQKHVSEKEVNIIKVDVIRVECNIVRGSYNNGTEGHVIHEFYPRVPPGYKIVEIPRTVVYLPVNVKRVRNLAVSLRDQTGDLVNLRRESLTVRLHLRRIQDGVGI